MATAVDYAARQIDPAAVRDAGHSAVIAYVSPSRPGANFGAKPLTRPYADQIRGVGLDIVSVWQYGKPGGSAPSDWTLGYDGGYQMGLAARENHFTAGGPGYCPIFFAVDEDLSLEDWNSTAVEFFRGVNAAIGLEWTGIYATARVCAWATEDNVIGGREGHRWVWQTRAWSGGEREPAAVLYQDVIDTPSSPGPQIDGSAVDVNSILANDFGQWSLDRAPDPTPVPATTARPEFVEYDQTGISPNCSSRQGAPVIWFLVHTQEGNGSAQTLANYLQSPSSQVSYHYTVDNDHQVVDVVDTDQSAWCALDANNRSINLCFAGSRASWTREEWLDQMSDGIDIAAYLAVQDCRRYGIPIRVISAAQLGAGEPGIADHYAVTAGLGVGTHTDVGEGFPWDTFAAALTKYSTTTEQDDDMAFTDADRTRLIEVWDQLRGPDGNGWPQLGQGEHGANLTPVDAQARDHADLTDITTRLTAIEALLAGKAAA
ncbi:glycoside hydrolase domain-containing protein [Nocardia sp. NPDC051052]|uniref:glycoside hydrolase domain-containing protein n=1 Tax=Nocardia sp. NPDC051052 TaxID=3364322 RepID=UPI00378A75B2